MDVTGFKEELVNTLRRARVGEVYRGRPPVGTGPAVSVDEASYEWEPEAYGSRGTRYRGELLQTCRIYTGENYSSAGAAEGAAYAVANKVINAAHGLEFAGLNALTVSSLEEETTWADETQSVVLRLEFLAVTYGPSILGETSLTPLSP